MSTKSSDGAEAPSREDAIDRFLERWLHFIGMAALAAACALVACSVSMMPALVGLEIHLITRHQVAHHKELLFARLRGTMAPLGLAMYTASACFALNAKKVTTFERVLLLAGVLFAVTVGYQLVDHVWHDWMHDRQGRKPALSLGALGFGLAICFGAATLLRLL